MTNDVEKAKILEAGSEVANNGSDLSANVQQEERGGYKPFHDLRLVDRYIKGEAHVLVHFMNREGTQFIACLQRDDAWVNHYENALTNRKGGGAYDRFFANKLAFFTWSQCASNRYGRNCYQHAVLVNDIQFVELPDLMAKSILIWLDTFENFEARLPKAFYFRSRYGLEVFGKIANWERRLLLVERDPYFLDKGASQVIERASEIMDGISEPKSEFRSSGSIIGTFST